MNNCQGATVMYNEMAATAQKNHLKYQSMAKGMEWEIPKLKNELAVHNEEYAYKVEMQWCWLKF